MTAKVVQNARNDVNQAFEALNELWKDSLPHYGTNNVVPTIKTWGDKITVSLCGKGWKTY